MLFDFPEIAQGQMFSRLPSEKILLPLESLKKIGEELAWVKQGRKQKEIWPFEHILYLALFYGRNSTLKMFIIANIQYSLFGAAVESPVPALMKI